MEPQSPYKDKPPEVWEAITNKLVEEHPLTGLVEKYPLMKLDKIPIIVLIVLKAWDSIFKSTIGERNFKIGEDIFPMPQVMGALLHELIPLEVAAQYPREWKRGESADEKDIVHKHDERLSIELKTSSHRSQIFGNRSYAQKTQSSKKSKSGYYLTINFEKFSQEKKKPEILLIRFGWLDHTDWIGQPAPTGQQSRLTSDIYAKKLKTLYSKS